MGAGDGMGSGDGMGAGDGIGTGGRPPETVELATAAGSGRALLCGDGGAGLLVLSHGAGGGVQVPDLLAVRDAAVALGWCVALVEQPWRVAGRRMAPAPARLDDAWRVLLPAVVDRVCPGGPVVAGGRSAGARVACRTARELGVAAVVALAFPLHPPAHPDRSRAPELAADVPVLVVQGERDPFGTPAQVRAAAPAGVHVTAVPGDHSLRRDTAAVAGAVTRWLVARSNQQE